MQAFQLELMRLSWYGTVRIRIRLCALVVQVVLIPFIPFGRGFTVAHTLTGTNMAV